MRTKNLFLLMPVLVNLLVATPSHPADWEKHWKEFDACLGSDKEVEDRSAAAAYYSCRRPVQECVTYLDGPRFWYDASPGFRAGIDEALLEPPEAQESALYRCSKTVPAALFKSIGVLAVTGEPADAAVYLNGAFAGRLPIETIEMPPGEYLVTLSAPGREGRGKVTVKAGETAEISLTAAPGEAERETSHETAGTPATGWWRTTGGERIGKLWASDAGVAAMLIDSKTFRFFDRATGFQLWETVLSLAAATEPRQAGDSLFWVSGTGMLNRLRLGSGKTEMLGKVGRGRDCRIVADGERVYAAGPEGRGGVLKAFSLRKGTESWSLTMPELPRELVDAGEVLLLLTEDGTVGSGTVKSIEKATGRTVWERFAADADEAVLAADGGDVFFWDGREDGGGLFLDALDDGEGTPLTIESGAQPVAASLADGHFFLVTGDERIYAYDPPAGRLLWDKSLGKGGSRATIHHVSPEGVTLIVNESQTASRKGDVRGHLVTLSRQSGKILFSEEVKLNQQSFYAGAGRLVVPDQLGTALVRDLERDCTAWQFRSTAPGMIRGNVTVAGGENRLYLAAQLKGKLFAFTPGECPPALSLPDLPVLEKPKPPPEPKEKEKKEERLVRKMPAERSAVKRSSMVVSKKKPARMSPVWSNSTTLRPSKEKGYAPPPAPSASALRSAKLPPLEKIPPAGMVGTVTQPALLERIAIRCVEQLDEWVVPETDGRDIMGYPAGLFVNTWTLRRPFEFTLSAQGRYTFIFDKQGAPRGSKGAQIGLGVTLIDPVFVTLSGDRRGVVFGVKSDKGFVGFWDSIARAEIVNDGTDVGTVEVQLFLPYALRGLFKGILQEDLDGDDDPETIVRYVPEPGGDLKDGHVELYYILGGGRVLFKAEETRIFAGRDGLMRETAVVYFEDRDKDGTKEIVLEKFQAACCKEDAWPEKVTEKPEVYRLVNNVYTAVP